MWYTDIKVVCKDKSKAANAHLHEISQTFQHTFKEVHCSYPQQIIHKKIIQALHCIQQLMK
jgi:hypothetical protein